MTAAFGHIYELYVGETESIVAQQVCSTGYDALIPVDVSQPFILRKNTAPSATAMDYAKVAQSALKITNPIQMTADIEYGASGKTSGGKTGAQIKLHNLSESTISKIKKPAMIMLNAGYASQATMPTVFIGTIDKVSTIKNVTTITAIEAGDLFRNSAINRMFSEKQTIGDVLKGLIYEFKTKGVPLGQFVESYRTKLSLGTTFAVTGNLKDRMTAICKAIDYTWFVSKNKLYVQPIDKDIVTDFVEITADNVIGEVSEADDTQGNSQGSASSKPSGVKFETFLNGYIGLETYLFVSYGSYKGIYKPMKIKISLDWYKGPWKMNITCSGVVK